MIRTFVFVFSLMCLLNSYRQSLSCTNITTEVEEKFVYGVSWSFFQLGTITITVEKIISNPDLKKISVDIKSAPIIPFISIDEYNETIINVLKGMTLSYYSIEKQDGKKVEVTYNYQNNNGLTIYRERTVGNKEPFNVDTLLFDKPYLVGSSLIYYIRTKVESGLVTSVPTMLSNNLYDTEISYGSEVEFFEIGEFDEPIRTIPFNVSADWGEKATAGLSGDFSGWLSDDKEAVVITAEMEILLGSIDLELEKWHKPGWIPPVGSINLITEKNN